MKKQYVIQNLIDKKYWYGFYTSNYWIDDITLAKMFENEKDVETWIETNQEITHGMILIIIKIWS